MARKVVSLCLGAVGIRVAGFMERWFHSNRLSDLLKSWAPHQDMWLSSDSWASLLNASCCCLNVQPLFSPPALSWMLYLSPAGVLGQGPKQSAYFMNGEHQVPDAWNAHGSAMVQCKSPCGERGQAGRQVMVAEPLLPLHPNSISCFWWWQEFLKAMLKLEMMQSCVLLLVFLCFWILAMEVVAFTSKIKYILSPWWWTFITKCGKMEVLHNKPSPPQMLDFLW